MKLTMRKRILSLATATSHPVANFQPTRSANFYPSFVLKSGSLLFKAASISSLKFGLKRNTS